MPITQEQIDTIRGRVYQRYAKKYDTLEKNKVPKEPSKTESIKTTIQKTGTGFKETMTAQPFEPSGFKAKGNFQEYKTPKEQIGKVMSIFDSEPDDLLSTKIGKAVGRFLTTPTARVIQNWWESEELGGMNWMLPKAIEADIIEGVTKGKYDPSVLDEFEILKKSGTQITAETAEAVLDWYGGKQLTTIAKLGYKVGIKPAAKFGAKIGAAYGLASAFEQPELPSPTEVGISTGAGALGGAILTPALNILMKAGGGLGSKVLGKKIAGKTEEAISKKITVKGEEELAQKVPVSVKKPMKAAEILEQATSKTTNEAEELERERIWKMTEEAMEKSKKEIPKKVEPVKQPSIIKTEGNTIKKPIYGERGQIITYKEVPNTPENFREIAQGEIKRLEESIKALQKSPLADNPGVKSNIEKFKTQIAEYKKQLSTKKTPSSDITTKGEISKDLTPEAGKIMIPKEFKGYNPNIIEHNGLKFLTTEQELGMGKVKDIRVWSRNDWHYMEGKRGWGNFSKKDLDRISENVKISDFYKEAVKGK